MQVSGYTLELYCDNWDGKKPDDDGVHVWGEFPHTFTGETGGICRQQARVMGWKLSQSETTKDLCPKCSGIDARFKRGITVVKFKVGRWSRIEFRVMRVFRNVVWLMPVERLLESGGHLRANKTDLTIIRQEVDFFER